MKILKTKTNKEVLVDNDIYELYKSKKIVEWLNYPYFCEDSKKHYLHKIIIKPPKGFVVDHIDGNPLNNQRDNLRVATIAQNTANSRKSSKNKSGYKGVWWRKNKQRFVAELQKEGIRYGLGMYRNIKDAAEAYNKGAIKHFGEFAKINNLLD